MRSLSAAVGLGAWLLTACSDGMADNADEGVGAAESQAVLSSGLSLSGVASVSAMDPDGWVYIDSALSLRNPSGQAVHLNKGLSLFATKGGFAFWAGDAIADSGAFFGIGPDVPPFVTQSSYPLNWNWSVPIVHEIHRVQGTTSAGRPIVGTVSLPVTRTGYAVPEPSPYTGDLVAALQLPIEILKLTSGERWLGVDGQMVDMTNTDLFDFPVVAAQLRSSKGVTVTSVPVTPVEGNAPLWLFLATTAIPNGSVPATLEIGGTLQAASGVLSVTRRVPVTTAAPVALASPVSGRWYWHNGPGQAWFNTHLRFPEQRYAYDLVMFKTVQGSPSTYQGDPTVNTSYFAFGKPIRAALAGTVVRVIDDVPDNHGNLQDMNPGRNGSIILQHAGGVFTIYTHVRQNSATVRAGQTVSAGCLLAQVGNAGASTEPHLHFAAYKLDAAGRVTALPLAPTDLRSTSGLSLSGVPKSEVEYVSR